MCNNCLQLSWIRTNNNMPKNKKPRQSARSRGSRPQPADWVLVLHVKLKVVNVHSLVSIHSSTKTRPTGPNDHPNVTVAVARCGGGGGARRPGGGTQRDSLGLVGEAGGPRRLVSVQVTVQHVETEAAHLRRHHHLPHAASRAGSRAQIRGEAGRIVAGRGRGQHGCTAATTTATAATTTTTTVVHVSPRSPQAVDSAHGPRCNSGGGGGGGTDPQVCPTVSGSRHPTPRPHPARTPRPGGSRQLLLLHPAAPGRHLGTICTDTPLPTHNRHRGMGGGERQPDAQIPEL